MNKSHNFTYLFSYWIFLWFIIYYLGYFKKYNPKLEFGIDPMDKEININWKSIEVIVSERDNNSPSFSELKSTESH